MTLSHLKLQTQLYPSQKPWDSTDAFGFTAIINSLWNCFFKGIVLIRGSCQHREFAPLLMLFRMPLIIKVFAFELLNIAAHKWRHDPSTVGVGVERFEIERDDGYLYLSRITWHQRGDGSWKNLHFHLDNKVRFLRVYANAQTSKRFWQFNDVPSHKWKIPLFRIPTPQLTLSYFVYLFHYSFWDWK